MTASIKRFAGRHAFLSNFYPARVEYKGRVYPSVEHAFQAAKTLVAAERDRIGKAPTPGKAKQLGGRVVLRPGWDAMRIDVMLACLRSKFSDLTLAAQLVETGDAVLVEGNHWRDRFWGSVDGVGENHLGKLLMVVRIELRRTAVVRTEGDNSCPPSSQTDAPSAAPSFNSTKNQSQRASGRSPSAPSPVNRSDPESQSQASSDRSLASSAVGGARGSSNPRTEPALDHTLRPPWRVTP